MVYMYIWGIYNNYNMTVRGDVGGGFHHDVWGLASCVSRITGLGLGKKLLPLGVQDSHLSMTGHAPRDPQRAHKSLVKEYILNCTRTPFMI